MDSDYAGDLDKRHFTIGYIFTMADGLASWRSILWTMAALSTTKAKYMAWTEAFKEAIWLYRLINDLGIIQDHVRVNCDSQSAIFLAKNQVHQARTKYIDVRFHFFGKVLNEWDILLENIGTANNPTNMLTQVVIGVNF